MDTMLLEYARLQRSIQPYAIIDPDPKNEFAAIVNPYRTVDAAIAAGYRWIKLADGTHAPFTLSEARITVEGGRSALVDGGITAHAVSISDLECVIRGFTIKTTPLGGSSYDGVNIVPAGLKATLDNVFVVGSDRYAVYANAPYTQIKDSQIESADSNGVHIGSSGDQSSVTGCHIAGCVGYGYSEEVDAENVVVTGNVVRGNTAGQINQASGTGTYSGNEA